MNIKYKIISYAEDEHSMVIRFYTDVTTEEDLAMPDSITGSIYAADGSIARCRTDTNLTLWDVPVLTGDAFEEMIMQQAPRHWFELLEKIKDPAVDTLLTPVKVLVGQERTVDTDTSGVTATGPEPE